jgi:Tfp pilus assembly protein PilV
MRQWFEMNKMKGNEQGIALISVLIVLIVVSVLGVSLMGLAASNFKMSTGERTNQSTYYIAESGATYMMSEVTKEVKDAYTITENQPDFYDEVESRLTGATFSTERDISSFTENFGQQPIAKVKVEKDNLVEGKYKIISTGTIDNRTRTVEKEFNIRWVSKTAVVLPDAAIFVDNTIKIESGSAIINGSIGTNSIENDAIELHSTSNIENGEIIVGPGGGEDVVNKDFPNIRAL